MKKFLSLTFIFFSSFSFAQILNGTAVLSSSNNMTVDITVDVPQNEVTIVLTGTNNQWFGFGFGGTQMFNRYSLITTGAGVLSERKLGNHNSGTSLTSSITSVNTTVSGSIRTVTLKRPIAGLNSNYFSFPTSPGSFIMIWAKGNGMNLANHGGGNRGSGMITLSNTCLSSTNILPSQNICAGDSTLFSGNYISTAGLYKDTLTNSAGCDSIIELTLAVSNNGPFPLSPVNFCTGDSISVFGKFVSTAGMYFDTVSNSNGCDSILSIQVNENLINYMVTYNSGDPDIVVTATGATFQWLENCDSVASLLVGQTSNILSTPGGGNGSYAVIVTINGCSDTSDCISYNFFGIEESALLLTSFHPNPVNNSINLSLNQSYQNLILELVNVQGKLVKRMNFQNGEMDLEIDLNFLAKGTYILKLNADGKTESQVILKN